MAYPGLARPASDSISYSQSRIKYERAEFADDGDEPQDALLIARGVQLAVGAVDLAGAIHLGDKLAEFFRLRLGRSNNGSRLD